MVYISNFKGIKLRSGALMPRPMKKYNAKSVRQLPPWLFQKIIADLKNVSDKQFEEYIKRKYRKV